MKQEIEAAAKWWADTIAGNPKQDNGDGKMAILMAILPSREERPTAEQCEAFRVAFTGSSRLNSSPCRKDLGSQRSRAGMGTLGLFLTTMTPVWSYGRRQKKRELKFATALRSP